MSLCGVVRGLSRLGVDAAEALLFLFDWSDPADELWRETCADRLADKEAEEEVAEPRTLWDQMTSEERTACLVAELDRRRARPNYVDSSIRFYSSTPPPTFTGLSSSPAPASAGDDRPPCSAPNPDVEQGGLPNLSHDELDLASYVIRRYAKANPAMPYDLLALADKLDPAK